MDTATTPTSTAAPTPAEDREGRVSLVGDVTSSKAAGRAMRTLWHSLGHRDRAARWMLQRANAAIEAERNRIARDLHDGPVQGVTAAVLSLDAIRLMLEEGEVEFAAATLAAVRAQLAEEADSLRHAMTDLRPPLLGELGLVGAVEALLDRFRRRHGIETALRAGCYSRAPEDIETLAYRVIQEALTNVGKHARATSVLIRIGTQPGTLEVEVVDDGAGFDTARGAEFARRGRVGLASMRERVDLGGGTLTVASRPGAGTSVKASLPFELPSAPRAARSGGDLPIQAGRERLTDVTHPARA